MQVFKACVKLAVWWYVCKSIIFPVTRRAIGAPPALWCCQVWDELSFVNWGMDPRDINYSECLWKYYR